MKTINIEVPGSTKPMTVGLDRVFANDVWFPHESWTHKVYCYAIGRHLGVIALIWADREHEALDIIADKGLLDTNEVTETEGEDGESVSRLGSHLKPYNLSDIWIRRINLEHQSLELLLRFAEARGALADTLNDI
jgi:hypothetical protein